MPNFKKPRSYDYNLLVIGGGSAGLIAALIAATVNAKVALVEKHLMGGDCLNTGCVPSKALISCAKKVYIARSSGEFGLSTSGDVDFTAVMAKVKGAIERIAPNDSMERFQGLGVDCFKGEASFVDPWTVKIDEKRITAKNIVIASGATPFVPPIEGLDSIGALTSDTVWDLESLPPKLLVLGAGPIGCELAQSFQRLGSQVTLVDMAPRILPNEDSDVAQILSDRLEKESVRLLTNSKAVAFREQAGERIMRIERDGDEQDIPFDEVIVAVGRRAHTESLGLDALDIKLNPNGTIVVDDYQRTSLKHVYACGDVAGPYQFTHMASHQAWYSSVNALFGMFRKFRINYSVVPWCTFTDPEVARVGLSEDSAAQQGIAVEVSRYDISDLDRAIAEGENAGFIKVLTHPGKDTVLGAVIVGPHAGELIMEFVLAMTHQLGLKKIMGTIHIYPTYSEMNKFVASNWRKAHAPDKLLAMLPRLHKLFR